MTEERVEVAVAQAAKRREIVGGAHAGAEAAFVGFDGFRFEMIEGFLVALPRRRPRMRRCETIARVAELGQPDGGVVQRTPQLIPLLRGSVVERALFDPFSRANPSKPAGSEHHEGQQPFLAAEARA